MNIRTKILFCILAMVSGSSVVNGAEPVKAAPTAAAPLEPIKSVFVIPASTKDGRDPFFPNSTRVYEVFAATAATAVHAVELTTLKIKGYSIINGQPEVIINNHAFMINDEGDVLTSSGRVHIRCIEIKPSSAVIEENGQTHTIRF